MSPGVRSASISGRWPGPREVAGFNIWNYNKNLEDSHAKPKHTLGSLGVVRAFRDSTYGNFAPIRYPDSC